MTRQNNKEYISWYWNNVIDPGCFFSLYSFRCFYEDMRHWPKIGLGFQIAFQILLCHSVMNPLIMLWLSQDFRKAFKKQFSCLRRPCARIFCKKQKTCKSPVHSFRTGKNSESLSDSPSALHKLFKDEEVVAYEMKEFKDVDFKCTPVWEKRSENSGTRGIYV